MLVLDDPPAAKTDLHFGHRMCSVWAPHIWARGIENPHEGQSERASR